MTRQLPVNPRAVADMARDVIARVRPAPLEARRSLPIRGDLAEISRLWSDADARSLILNDIPVADATIEFGPEVRDWGTIVSVRLELESAVPGMAAQVLAGKVVRRLKALAETGEVPTTAHNPSGRADAEEAEA